MNHVQIRWTQATVMEAVRAFKARTGAWPRSHEWSRGSGLPSYATLLHFFGGIHGLRTAMLPPVQPPAPPPGPRCNRCDRPFAPESRLNRTCPDCKQDKSYAEDGAWMGAGIVRG